MLSLVLVSPALASWNEQVLYSFQGGANDGFYPTGGVVFDKAGNLYGTTIGAGSGSCAPDANECGLVYQLSPPAKKGGTWSETIIVQFKGEESQDASSPSGGLILDSAGNLYGVTAYGGTGNCVLLGTKAGCGTVYELSPPQKNGGPWTETILYSFQGGNDGYFPLGDLTFDKAGDLYGATDFGGGKGNSCNPYYGGNCGTVFKLSPPKQKGGTWSEQVVFSFAGPKDGANPNGGLVLDNEGAIYGTTFAGGNSGGECGTAGCGTVFELKPPTRREKDWTERQLHLFKAGSDGARPYAGVIFDAKGNIYGTTVGTVFRLAPSSKKSGEWKQTILWQFNNNAYDSQGGLVFDRAHNLYGTTYSGNAFSGTIFRVRPPRQNGKPWAFSILYGFTGQPDGAQPDAGLVFGKAGTLYGTTFQGGSGTNCGFAGCGTVFKVWP